MKSKAYGWLAAAVLAAGLNATYHDGGLEWAHQAIDGIGHNVSAVLALASGRADQFLAEAQLASAKNGSTNEPTTCRLATAWTRIQTRMAHRQTRLDRMQAKFVQTGLTQAELAESSLTQYQSAGDRLEARSEEMSARREAAMARLEVRRVRMEAEAEQHLQARMANAGMAEERMAEEGIVTARLRPVAMQMMNFKTGCQRLRLNVRIPQIQVPQIEVPQVKVPQVHIPEINVPDVHIPRIHIPAFNVPSVSVDATSGPV